MKNKTKLQKLIALFSVIMLLVTSLGLQVLAGDEKDATTYKTIGVERITGMDEWKLESGERTKSAEGNLDGVLLDGVYNFSNGSGSINIGNGLWTGLQISFLPSGLNMMFANGAGNTDVKGSITFSREEAGYTTFFGTDLRVKLAFAFSNRTETTVDVVITATVGNAVKELVLDEVNISQFGRSISIATGDSTVVVKEVPKTYETIGVNSITKAINYTVSGAEKTKSVAGSLEGVLLDGYYNFSDANGSINIGDGAWTALQLGFSGAGFVVQYANEASNKDNRGSVAFSAAEGGYTTFWGTDLRVKLAFAFSNKTETTADVAVTVTFGKATKKLYLDNVNINKFGRSMFVYAGAGATVAVKAAPSTAGLEGLTVITPADFGYADGTHDPRGNMTARKKLNANQNSSKNISLNGKVLVMDVQFRERAATETYSGIYIGNIDGNAWHGLVLDTNPWNHDMFTLYNAASGGISQGNVITATGMGLNSESEKFNLKLSFEFVTHDTEGENNDVKIGLWVNDIHIGYYYDDNHTEYYDASLSFFNNMTISSPKNEAVPTDNTPYMLEDFGIGDVTSTAVKKAIQPMTEGGSSISGKVALSEQSGMTLYGGAAANGEWLGVRLYLNGDKLDIGHVNLGVATSVTDVKANQVFTFTVTEQIADWNADGVKDDVRFGIWINGKHLFNIYALEYKDSVSKTFMVYPYVAGATMTKYTDVVYANAVDGYTVEGEGVLTVNNAEVSKGTVLSTSGEYIVRCANAGAYVEYVAVYRIGDAHVDNEVNVLDLVSIRNASQGGELPASKTGKKAADVDGNGTIEAADCVGVRNILVGAQ